MAVMKKRDSNISNRTQELVDTLNLNKQPSILKKDLTQYSIKLYPQERAELDKIFSHLGLNSFSNGVRFALTEFKRNHLKETKQ